MWKNLKKLMCVLLSTLMIISVLPVGMVADGETGTSSSVMTSILSLDNLGDSSLSSSATSNEDGSITFTDVEQVYFKLPETLSEGETLYVHATGTSNIGVRVYLVTDNVWAVASSTGDATSTGEFEITKEITVTSGVTASQLNVKGPYGSNTSLTVTFSTLEIYVGTKTQYECEVNGGHIYTYTSNGDATCTEDGTKTGTCSTCGKTVVVDDEGSATGHTYVDGVCTVCGNEQDHCTSIELSESNLGNYKNATFTDGVMYGTEGKDWITLKLPYSYSDGDIVTVHISGTSGNTVRVYLSSDTDGRKTDIGYANVDSNGNYDATFTFTVTSNAETTVHEGDATYISIKSHSSGQSFDNLVVTHLGVSDYDVTVASSTNGTVTTDKTSACAGNTVTLTVTPDDLYELDTLTVTDRSGNVVTTTAVDDSTYTFTMPASNVTVSATFVSDGTKVITPVTISEDTTSVAQKKVDEEYIGECSVDNGTISVSSDSAPLGVFVKLSDTSYTAGTTVTLKITGTTTGDFRMYLEDGFSDTAKSAIQFASDCDSSISSATSANPIEFSFTVSLTVYDDVVANTLMIKGVNSYTALTELTITSISIISSTPSFYGRALTLDGEIGVTYYFSMDGVTNPEAYSLVATVNGETAETVHGANKTIGGVTYYRYTVYVSVADINSTISAYLTDGTTTVSVSDYSVATYCTEAASVSDKESALCQALMTYGYYTGVLIEEDTKITDYTDVSNLTVGIDAEEYGSTETTGVAKTLALDSTISIRMYLTSDVASDATFTVNGNELTVNETTDNYKSDYPYYIEFKVSARNLDTMYTVYKNGEEFTKYSVYTYIMNNYQDTETTGLADLCKAIYNYSLKAEDYNGWV